MRANFVQQPATLWPANRPDDAPYYGLLVYRLSDPYAVELVIPRGDGRKTVKVLLGRAVLIDGLEAPTTAGLLRIEPHYSDDRFITLTLPLGECQQELHVARAAAEAFVDATLRLVPLGRETDLIDFDGWLLELAP